MTEIYRGRFKASFFYVRLCFCSFYYVKCMMSTVQRRLILLLKPLIESIPKDLSKTKRVAMGKEKIRALFRYDKSYPRWIQGAEWPIVNGKPLVFSHQERIKGDG